jgi:Putative lumazine-binding
MKTLYTALALAMATLSISGVSTAQSAPQNVASDAEREAAMEPVRAYVKAHETGDGAFILAAFHKDARLAGSINGSFVTLTAKQYAADFSGKPAKDEADSKRTIELLDLTNDAGVAKVILDYPSVQFIDYMQLVKVSGKWVIVNKSFYGDRRPRAKRAQ